MVYEFNRNKKIVIAQQIPWNAVAIQDKRGKYCNLPLTESNYINFT